MQNKGAIRLVAIALALVSIYQLSFTWIVSNVKDDASEYAKGNSLKETAYLDSISGKGVYDFLWIRDYTFRECQDREINLGLDLKGGMNVILEVSVIDLIQSLSNYSKDVTYTKVLNLAIERQRNSQDDFLTLFGQAFKEVAPEGSSLASIFNTIDLRDRINFNSTNDEVLSILREETKSAIDNSFNILRTRIDRFGVSQPNIQQLGVAGRILVELPGIKDPERVRKLLQGTANLEFWETYDNTEVFEYLKLANEKIKGISTSDNKVEIDETEIKKDSNIVEDLIVNEQIKKDSTEEIALLDELNKDSTVIANKKYDDAYAAFAKENPLFAVLRPSTDREGNLLRGATVGTSHVKDTAKVNELLKLNQVKEILPRNLKLLWEVKAVDYKAAGEYFQLVAIKITNRDGQPALGGDVVTNARAEFGQNQATAEVSMSMNAEGSQIWARLTKDNVGKQIAIVLDNYVYSAPNVSGEIKGGRSQITGHFSVLEAKDLANILKSGKLPAPAKIIEEEIVGPSLGLEAINSGLISFILAFIIVLVYMIFYYNKAGYVANIALITNVFFIFGVLASIGAVLTLPGLAGIVLTIGMSVDANVLIYDRIREELGLGKGLKLAISDGYKNAYSAILDANVTTLLTAIVLFVFGHGPIKGFATTLIIGILTSLFSAIFITRLIFTWMLDRKKSISFATRFTENAFKNVNIQFIGKRKIFYVISGVLIAISIFSLFTRGLNQGIDFKGGRTYVVKFQNDVKTDEIAKILKVEFGDAPEVKTYGDLNQVKISTKYLVDSNDDNADSIVEAKLFIGLKPVIGDKVDFDTFIQDYRQSSRKVGPTIADDIRIAAIYSILFSLLIMFLYIFIRFNKWQFGLGAIAALAHDVLIVLGVFSLFSGIVPFSLEIDQAFIAAILTVIGYSLNDTVVVFDRIREYIREKKRGERTELYNAALNSTLSRTFSTSFSTFIVLLAIFIFGGEVIRGFIFAMLIGVVVGTYSSLFIATPVVFDSIKVTEKKEVDEKKVYKGSKKKEKTV
ncbi:MAG: protein translocase subunit SecDF [Bacteroidales bacterium]|nr:protein translocase subunit SecDF [Bacteroidales bacterium]MBN2756020.1 protein translocase subunit SecDF [Bacteroidales bacterium]